VILPGSRTQEVTHNLRWFLKAAAMIRDNVPDVRFALAAFKPHQAEIAQKMIDDAAARGGKSHLRGEGIGLHGDAPRTTRIGTVPCGLPIEVCLGKTPELMRLADCAMSVSGSVSLELLYHTTPTVILYWIDRFAYFVQGFFRKVDYITLVNLLSTHALEREEIRGQKSEIRGQEGGCSNATSDIQHPTSDCALFPEYLTCEDKSAEVAGHIIEWLTDPASRAARVEALKQLKARVAHGGASQRAAEYILEKCQMTEHKGA
jgi:lipid-A-disaccharide synthase